MGEDNSNDITRSEIELIVQLGNEKIKGEIMEHVITNKGEIKSNRSDVGEIKADVKSIMNILRNRDKLLVGTLLSSIATVIILAITIVLAVI